MAQWVKRLRSAKAARVQSLVPARPTVSVEKYALFCNPASGGTSQALQLLYSWLNKIAAAKAKVFPHLEAWVRMSKVTIEHSGFDNKKRKNALK
jgi:hypothetical protein